MGNDLGRKLIVGREIQLNGEIGNCDHLIVEGDIEVSLTDCRLIEIAEAGRFKGVVEIDNADVSGRFEGDIVVRDKLRVRSTGHLSGNIRYGSLEIERGGQITGNVSSLSAQVPAEIAAEDDVLPWPAVADGGLRSAGEGF